MPVVCIGNAVLGGAGKTPVALAVAERLAAAGHRPHFLSRGYGGRERGPVRVDPAAHGAGDVGDEPLLLARAAPAWVARNRPAGAVAAAGAGASIVVMDDGFQNGSLAKDAAILVADGAVGYGNGRVFPAGPLREPAEAAHARADALVVVGHAPIAPCRTACPGSKRASCRRRAASGLRARPFSASPASAGPAKFAETLQELGARLVDFRAFPDHHAYKPEEAAALLEQAAALGARCVTTEKDAVRLPADIRDAVETVAVNIEWRDPGELDRILQEKGLIA